MDRWTDGQVYGQDPKHQKLPDVPDIESMMEVADVPLGDGPDVLPYSLEWYAGAKDRQLARDAEKEKLVVDRSQLRKTWSDLATTELSRWIDTIEEAAGSRENQEINILLARTVNERPYDTKEINLLKTAVDKAEQKRKVLREETKVILSTLRRVEDCVVAKEAHDAAEEQARLEKEKAEFERKAKAKAAVKKAQQMMYGGGDDDSDEEPASPGGEPEAEAPTSGGQLPPLNLPSGSPGQKTGMAAQLPPLDDPPVPPQLT